MKIIHNKHNKEGFVKFKSVNGCNGVININIDCPKHKYLEFNEGSCDSDFCIWMSSCDGDEEFFNEYRIEGLEFGSEYTLLATPQKWEYVLTLVPLFDVIFNEENEEIEFKEIDS